MIQEPRNYMHTLKAVITILTTNASILVLFLSCYYVFYNPNYEQQWDVLLRNEITNGSACGFNFYTVASVADLPFDSNTSPPPPPPPHKQLETGRNYDFGLIFKVKPFDIAKILPSSANTYVAVYDSTLNVIIQLLDSDNNLTNSYFTTILLPTKKDLGVYYYWQYFMSLLNVVAPFYAERNLIDIKAHIRTSHTEKYQYKATKRIKLSLSHLCSTTPPQLTDIKFYIREEMHGLRYLINSYPNLTYVIFWVATLSSLAFITTFMVVFYMRTVYQKRSIEPKNEDYPSVELKNESQPSNSLLKCVVKQEETLLKDTTNNFD